MLRLLHEPKVAVLICINAMMAAQGFVDTFVKYVAHLLGLDKWLGER